MWRRRPAVPRAAGTRRRSTGNWTSPGGHGGRASSTRISVRRSDIADEFWSANNCDKGCAVPSSSVYTLAFFRRPKPAMMSRADHVITRQAVMGKAPERG